ncbi:Ig-like domain-containing protein, partial [Roseivirga sp.]|uniref:Ig-like domain-containing protein n=1 Tax=Roseivirga sp. TaxID=1964215 RepID=UPI003B8E08BA
TSPLAVSYTQNGSGSAYTIIATDANTVTYSLGTGNDESLFDLTGGVVTFKTSPDFENTADGDGQNTYEIEVNATDGLNTATQMVVITVTDVDEEGPVLVNLDPLDETTIPANQSLRAQFDELIFKGTGKVKILNESSNELVQEIDISSNSISIDGNTLTIDPPSDLPIGEDLTVLIANTAIVDGAGNDITGIFNNTTWNHSVTGADLVAPRLVSLDPADGSNVESLAIVTATFSEPVFANQGRLRIYRKSDLLLLRNSDINSDQVMINGTKVSVKMPGNLINGEEIIVHFSRSSLVDGSGNEIGSIFNDETWNLIPQIDQAPLITTLSPADGSTVNAGSTITATFNEVLNIGTGKVRIYRTSDGQLLHEVDISDQSVVVSGSSVSVELPLSLSLGVEIAVHFAGSTLQDQGGNDITGVFTTNTWNLTPVVDPSPSIESLSPLDGGSFSPGEILTLTLSESVTKNSGKIRIYRSSDNTVLREIDVSSADVEVNGSVVKVTTPLNLPVGQNVFIHFAPNTLRDSGNNGLNGLFGVDTWNLTTIPDPAPSISQLSPVDGGSLIQGFNIEATFSEAVFKGSGKVRFYRSSDTQVLKEMNIGDGGISITGAVVTITPPLGLPTNEEIFVHFAGSTLLDSRGNNIGGVFTATTWNLTMQPDPSPTIVSLSPVDGGSVVQGSTTTVTFSEAVFKNRGKIRIYKKGDLSLLNLIDVSDPSVTVDGASVSIDMPLNLPIGEEILIHFSPLSFEDAGGNGLGGLFDVDTWNLFPQSDPGPTITSLSPADGGSAVAESTITATFSEAVFKNEGRLRIYRKSDLLALHSVNINSAAVVINGNTLTYDLPSSLPAGEELLVHLGKSALVDGGNNNIDGLFTVETWNFTITGSPAMTLNTEDIIIVPEQDLSEQQEMKVQLYPNPSTGIFKLDLRQAGDSPIVEIYDFTGRMVF